MIIGVISHNLYKTKMKETPSILIPLLKCHIEKYSVLEISREKMSTMCLQYGFFPITMHQLSNALIEKIGSSMFSEPEKIDIKKKLESAREMFHHQSRIVIATHSEPAYVNVYCCLRIAKPDHKKISGNVWCTEKIDASVQVKDPEIEYWLLPEDVDISNFIMVYVHEKRMMPPSKREKIFYEVTKIEHSLMQGKAKVGNSTFKFARNIMVVP